MRTPARSRVFFGLAATTLALGSALLTGCASPEASSEGGTNTPGAVALQFSEDWNAGRFDEATALVAPDYRDVADRVAAAAASLPFVVSESDTKVGAERIDGDKAAVTLVGRRCFSPKTTPAPSPADPADCEENSDLETSNPSWLYQLTRLPDGKWYVVLGADEPDPIPSGMTSAPVAPPPTN